MKNMIQKYKESYAGLPKEAWWLALVVLVNRSGMMVVFFMTLYLTRKMGFSIGQAAQVMTVWGIGSLFGSYLGGWLSDRWGTFRVQFYSLIWNGLGFIILGQMNTLASISITIFIVAVVGEAFRPANITAFTEICPPEIRARGIVLDRLAANLGIAVGPAVGGFLARHNYGYLFWVDGLTCIAAAVVFFILFHAVRPVRIEAGDEPHRAFRSPWRDGLFLSILGLLLVVGVVFFQIFNIWPLYMREVNGFLENQIGILLTVNCLLLVLLEMPVIHHLEKRNPLQSIMAGVVFLFSGFFLIPFGSSYGYAVITVVLWTFGEMLVFPLIATFIANRADDRNLGQYMGLFTLTFSLAFVLGPIGGSAAYTQFGPRWVWMSTGMIGLVVWLGFFSVNQYLKRLRALPS